MINGVMTLSGAWHKLRDDPILKFLITSLSFYGMSTFEGPMMAIKTVNALSHYTDWTIGHVHSGALGWVAMISIGSIYYLLPRLFAKPEMFSVKLITVHFWVATIGVVLYIASMWIAGVMQGLMWRAVNADGTLTYSFVESVKASYPFWAIRFLGGCLFLSGMLIMAYNTVSYTHLDVYKRQVHTRSVAQVGGAPVRAAGKSLDLDREDALQRRPLVFDADVGRGEAQLPTELVSPHDASVDRVGAAEQTRGVFEATRLERVANRRAGGAFAFEGDAVHGLSLIHI